LNLDFDLAFSAPPGPDFRAGFAFRTVRSEAFA